MKLIPYFLFILITFPCVAQLDDKHFATVLDESVIAHDVKSANREVFTTLFNHYAELNNLIPTNDDFKKYNEFKKLSRELDIKELKITIEELKTLEASRALSETELKKREVSTTILSHYQNQQLLDTVLKQIKSQVPDFLQQTIKIWKINQSLYKKYGGGVVFQQAGLEPVDAWFAFFKSEVNNGNLVFNNKDFEDQFWNKITPNKTHWSYNAEPKAPFKEPVWVAALDKIKIKLNKLKQSEIN
jgi:hypothetical protein